MKRRTLLSLATALLVAFIFVDIASAYYHPSTGRFIGRDPIGEPGHVLVRSAASSRTFLPRDPVASASVSSSRGLVMPLSAVEEPHTYRAMRNNPLTWIDPDGGMSIAIPPCDPEYPPPNPPPGADYDCVGLACRDYSKGRDPDDLLNKFRVGLQNCSVPCEPCEVKCWQWNYRLDVYRPSGALFRTYRVGHIVCGQVGCNGEEPLCYNKMTKYGKLEGPKPCASFRPPASGNPIEIGPGNTAEGFTVKRSEFEEHCYCGPVVPPSSLPKWPRETENP